MPRQFFIYIMTNKPNGTLYIGFTNNLVRRVFEHRNGLGSGFTSKYGLRTLVYYEVFATAFDAIQRETSLKRWRRSWKLELIESLNPQWRDLGDEASM
jgi:putative endonuclease